MIRTTWISKVNCQSLVPNKNLLLHQRPRYPCSLAMFTRFNLSSLTLSWLPSRNQAKARSAWSAITIRSTKSWRCKSSIREDLLFSCRRILKTSLIKVSMIVQSKSKTKIWNWDLLVYSFPKKSSKLTKEHCVQAAIGLRATSTSTCAYANSRTQSTPRAPMSNHLCLSARKVFYRRRLCETTLLGLIAIQIESQRSKNTAIWPITSKFLGTTREENWH